MLKKRSEVDSTEAVHDTDTTKTIPTSETAESSDLITTTEELNAHLLTSTDNVYSEMSWEVISGCLTDQETETEIRTPSSEVRNAFNVVTKFLREVRSAYGEIANVSCEISQSSIETANISVDVVEASSNVANISSELLPEGSASSDVTYVEVTDVPHECVHCKEAFRSVAELENHKGTHWIFVCDGCFKTFYFRNLIEHSALHREEVSYACYTCSRVYEIASGLTRHMHRPSGKRKLSYTCDKCKKTFNSQEKLSRHLFIQNNKLKGLTCLCCNAKFRSELGLKIHITTCHQRRESFRCDHCGKGFIYAWILHDHSC